MNVLHEGYEAVRWARGASRLALPDTCRCYRQQDLTSEYMMPPHYLLRRCLLIYDGMGYLQSTDLMITRYKNK